MASFYSGEVTGKNSFKTRIRLDVDYTYNGGTSYTVNANLYLECTNKSGCPYYAYSTTQSITLNGNNVSRTSVQPNAEWHNSVWLYSHSISVDPGGPAKDIGVSASYTVPSGTYTYSSRTTFNASGTVTLPATWQKPGQTYVTRITNSTSGTVKNSGDQAIDSTWWENNNTNTNYAGDSLTLWWDKNSEGSVGSSADPTSRAFFTRDIDNNHDEYDTLLLQPWDWTGGGGDLASTQYYTIAAADCGNWLKCMMYKSYVDSGGTRQHFLQGALEYVKPAPTISSDVVLRSKRFYTNTPSCAVWRVNTFSTTNNGYGMSQTSTNNNSQGYKNSSTTAGKFA